MENKEEIWKPITGHDGYEVSNFGNVRSFRNPNGRGLVNYYKILKQYDSKGYLCVWLSRKFYSVHRLVATAFIPNPDNLPQVNHKDENKTNNRVENLEWCTCKYNLNYGTAQAKRINKSNKPVLCVELNKTFPSAQKASEWLNNKYAFAGISLCCNGYLKTAYKYHWKFVENNDIKKEVK